LLWSCASPLRRRYLMTSLTDSALSAVKSAILRSGKDGAGFRVKAETGGCAGYKYQIGLDTQEREGDTVVDAGDDVKVFVDSLSQPLLAGMQIDFVESLEGAGFVFENPNATNSCSCGKSFS
jgi:iron-sulfur cluster assembly protein